MKFCFGVVFAELLAECRVQAWSFLSATCCNGRGHFADDAHNEHVCNAPERPTSTSSLHRAPNGEIFAKTLERTTLERLRSSTRAVASLFR